MWLDLIDELFEFYSICHIQGIGIMRNLHGRGMIITVSSMNFDSKAL